MMFLSEAPDFTCNYPLYGSAWAQRNEWKELRSNFRKIANFRANSWKCKQILL